MEFILSDTENDKEENTIINNLWKHNSQFTPVDIHPLRVIFQDNNQIQGGLIARTWWGGLDIQYLWITENYRKKNIGKKLMQMAEDEAIKRKCHMAYVDTFDFQAVNFYKKLGYEEYGHLSQFAHRHTRYYLSKQLGI
ncbi:GNAT family N-acetyltransferase [Arsenophonus sp. ENCA]|uniref:GNAT family N-acetyltransferase n=1 Tax=Arsenophonus TaxID=637 RepID=UPI000BD18C01|nr:GNAT family N-acetyltransferase [Arsenophonus sp. ENCA]PAV10527.1 GNAT family N-acetyltransferase [Arsenophonus sp. ENCA]